MYEMLSPDYVKQRHEDLLREADQNRVAKALREARKRHASQTRAPRWEVERITGRLLLRSLRSSK